MTVDIIAALDMAEETHSSSQNKVERALKRLADRGLPADRIRQALDTGPLGHAELSRVLRPFMEQAGMETLTSDNIRRYREKVGWKAKL